MISDSDPAGDHADATHDTTAQRPTNIGEGTPGTPPERDPDRANELPTLGAQPPLDTEKTRLREPHHVAAGLPALTQSLHFTIRETGLTRGIGDWLRVNKKDGFDCQSCAWPNPDERHVFEFCESGVKALASEGTRKH